MTNPTSPITSRSESTSKTKVIFDRDGKIIGLGDPWDYPTTLGEAIATDSLFIDNLQNTNDPKNGIFFSLGNYPILPTTDYFIAGDYRTETRAQLQSDYIAAGGATGNPFLGVTNSVVGFGRYQNNELLMQSVVHPTPFAGTNLTWPTISTDQKKFLISSARFLGINGITGADSGGITLPSVVPTSVSNQVWVLDMFFRPESFAGGNNQVLAAKRPDPSSGSTANSEWILYYDAAATRLRFSYRSTAATGPATNVDLNVTTTAITADEWHHVAVAARGGQYVRTYFNGVSGAASGSVSVSTGDNQIVLGADLGGENGYRGYIDNFRLIIGSTSTTEHFYGSGGTCFVPVAQSAIGNSGEVQLLMTMNGVNTSTNFTVQTPSYVTGSATEFLSNNVLGIRKEAIYGTCDGFSAALSYGCIQGFSSGAAWRVAKITGAGLTLSEIKDIASNQIEYDFIRRLQESITGEGSVTGSSNPFPRLFGFAATGATGYYGPTGATSNYFSIIPSRENITYLSNFVNAKNVGATLSGSTIFLADSGGTLHAFTPTNVQDLYIDLYNFFTTQEGNLGVKKKAVNDSISISDSNKITFEEHDQEFPSEAV